MVHVYQYITIDFEEQNTYDGTAERDEEYVVCSKEE